MFLDLRSVSYYVEDLQKAKEWYCKALDAVPVVDESSRVVFAIGNGRMHLNASDHPVGKNGSGSIAYWTVSDIDAECKRLIELGAVEHGGIRDSGEGVLRAAMEDPFGNMLGIEGAGAVPDNKAIEERPSVTALWTTQMRAFSAREENEEIRGPDDLAEIFLYGDQLDSLETENRERVKETFFVKGICEYVMARTRIFDRFFKEALEDGFEQIVFLGAGYDTRPYRFKARLGSARIFELDIAPTQEYKKQCLAGAGIDIPSQLAYVPINFNTDSIKDVLSEAGYDKDKKTLFMWEGVTYYLAGEAVDAILGFIKSNSPAGSAVAFDYVALWAGLFDAYGVKELVEFNQTKQSGESANFFNVAEGAIESFLSERGFAVSVHQNSEELEKNFLTLEDGTLFGHVTGSFRIVRALTTDS